MAALFFLIVRPPPISTLFPYTTLFRSLRRLVRDRLRTGGLVPAEHASHRSEEHTSELQSRGHLVCRLLLEKTTRCLRQAEIQLRTNQRLARLREGPAMKAYADTHFFTR